MGMIGTWIDEELTDADRDAIIRHPDPSYGGDDWARLDDRDCGCLVGTVVLRRMNDASWSLGEREYPNPMGLYVAGILPYERASRWMDVGFRFPILTARFGPERVWRAVKFRCARRNGTLDLLREETRDTVRAGGGS